MPSAFHRTGPALHADRSSAPALSLMAALLVGAGWIAWFLLGHVSLYEVTSSARLESDRAAHHVQSPIDGRITSVNLTLGRRVEAGELLAEVESSGERLQRQEKLAEMESLSRQLQTIEREVELVEQTGRNERLASQTATEAARAQAQEVDLAARFAEEEAARVSKLRAAGLIALREHDRSSSEARQKRSSAESMRLNVARLAREQTARDSDREARLERLRGEATKLTGDVIALRATLDRLQYEIGRRAIRAPIAGVLGEAAQLKAGAVVKAGDTIGAVIPAGGVRVAADFLPAAALGRVRPGQKARLRMDGFNWVEYGTVLATVTHVGSEVRQGRVRVELALDSAGPAIPLEHGLPGAVEIEVERISPAELALRAAGRLATASRSPFEIQAQVH